MKKRNSIDEKYPKKINYIDAHGVFYNENPEEYSIYFERETSFYILEKNDGLTNNNKYDQQYFYSINSNNQLEYTSFNLYPDIKKFTIKQLEKIVEALNLNYCEFNFGKSKTKFTKLEYNEWQTFSTISMSTIEFDVFKKYCIDILDKGKTAGNVVISDKKMIDYYILQNWNKYGIYKQKFGNTFYLSSNGYYFYKLLMNIN
jgi:hypothetical protein